MAVGSLEYLANLFRMALLDMATGTKSLSKRLASAYSNYLYKIDWDKDRQIIPLEAKNDFEELGKLLTENLLHDVEMKKLECKASGWTNRHIESMIGASYVISNYHWRKAQKIAQKIAEVHFLLSLEIRFNTAPRSKASNSTPLESEAS